MNQKLLAFDRCPSCYSSSNNGQILFSTKFLGEICNILQCTSCGLVYKEFFPTTQGLAKIYSDSYVHFQSADKTVDLSEINSTKQKLNRCQKLLKTTFTKEREKPRLLDVGCGGGNFVEIARNLGYIAEGIDPYLPEKVKKQYLRQQVPNDILPQSYDIVSLLNVAEHLDKPRDLFMAIRKILKPGGVLLLTCPYGNSLARYFHQASWSHLVLDEHLLFWTPKSLTYLLREIGFDGDIHYRIAGSPFPYGRTTIPTNINESKTQTELEVPINKKIPLQSRIWQIARSIQRQEHLANLVRYLVNLTHTGDYLEYAISVKH